MVVAPLAHLHAYPAWIFRNEMPNSTFSPCLACSQTVTVGTSTADFWANHTDQVLPPLLDVQFSDLTMQTPEERVMILRLLSAASTNAPEGAGHRTTLCSALFPRTASTHLPLRLWWQNNGTAPDFRPLRTVIWVGDTRCPSPTAAYPMPLGDCMENIVLPLPNLSAGAYPLAIERNERVPIGILHIDRLEHLELVDPWQAYYPDGYYPLEDPVLPK